MQIYYISKCDNINDVIKLVNLQYILILMMIMADNIIIDIVSNRYVCGIFTSLFSLTPVTRENAHIRIWERKIFLAFATNSRAPSTGLVAREVFWPARKIDKNAQINAGRGSGTTGCHLAFLYKSLLGLKDVPSPCTR